MTISKITKVLEILNDGKWHRLETIRRETKIDNKRVQQIIGFLKEYSFVVVDEAENRIRISREVQKFLTDLSAIA